jgi:hypothetical protein
MPHDDCCSSSLILGLLLDRGLLLTRHAGLQTAWGKDLVSLKNIPQE